MQELLFETVLIAILIFLNGYLAGTEIAVVTARKSHIKELAEGGKKDAQIFLKLKEHPDRFLATDNTLAEHYLLSTPILL